MGTSTAFLSFALTTKLYVLCTTHRNVFGCAGPVFFVRPGAAAVVPEGVARQKRKYGSCTKGAALACEMQLAGSFMIITQLCSLQLVQCDCSNGAVNDCRLFWASTLARERQALLPMRPTTSRTTSTRLRYFLDCPTTPLPLPSLLMCACNVMHVLVDNGYYIFQKCSLFIS